MKEYTKEEVIQLFTAFVKECEHNEDLICHYDGDYRDLNEWLEKNL